MQYISPVSILPEFAINAVSNKKQSLLLKKKMLAELELAGGTVLKINGKELSKNDIILFFDNIAQVQNINYHQEVYKDEVLRIFLEKGTLEEYASLIKNPIYIENTFIEWISPYYCNSFIQFANDCLIQLTYVKWETLLNNPFLMTSFHQEEAWMAIEKFINSDRFRLEYYIEQQSVAERILEVERLTDECYFSMMLLLDENRFQRVRDDYAFAVMQASIQVFNENNTAWGINTLSNVRNVAVTADLIEQIQNKILEMCSIEERNQGRSSANSESNANPFSVLRILFFLFILIWRLVTCSNNSEKDRDYNYDYPTKTYITDSSGNQITVDSFLNKLKKGGVEKKIERRGLLHLLVFEIRTSATEAH